MVLSCACSPFLLKELILLQPLIPQQTITIVLLELLEEVSLSMSAFGKINGHTIVMVQNTLISGAIIMVSHIRTIQYELK